MDGQDFERFPTVTMGMPVYNGEPYLEAALKSLLAQTYTDFEILISDNASTDRTRDICLDYARTDPRISYSRREANVGFCRNQNDVILASRGKYFLLTHDDDLRAEEYLEKTVEVMEADDSIVVCYTGTQDIDADGNYLDRVDPELNLDSPRIPERFREVIRMDHICEPDFGLTRMDVLRETRLHGAYADSDRVLLAELLMYGTIYRIPAVLFFRRAHALQSTAIASDRQSRTVFFDPSKKGKMIFPYFQQLGEYLDVIRQSPISNRDAAACYGEIIKWVIRYRRKLSADVNLAVRNKLRPLYHRLRSRERTG